MAGPDDVKIEKQSFAASDALLEHSRAFLASPVHGEALASHLAVAKGGSGPAAVEGEMLRLAYDDATFQEMAATQPRIVSVNDAGID